jgi:hypothetical protein
VASMYVDRKAPLHVRASAQAIFTFATIGAGPLLGNWLSAQVMQARTVGDVVDWSSVWLWPAGLAAGILTVYLILFRETGNARCFPGRRSEYKSW